MTPNQEEALFEFLNSSTGTFELNEVISFIRRNDTKGENVLGSKVKAYIDYGKIAFSLGPRRWMSKRGFFEPLSFVISPTRLELLNGILIPGHRCIPFANNSLFPHEYSFFWQGSELSFTTTEGPPEEFYPYYSILGEEYAPQYVAMDNSQNEEIFSNDPYDDDPVEVSVRTLDMRNVYRETSFVPGDRFVVKTLDWKQGSFELEKVGKDEWGETDLKTWLEAADEGFELSFNKLGTASCTEEQISYAYWYGTSRMKEVPAYSLEAYLYEKTDKIETAAYGIETRFWYAGREIPDKKEMETGKAPPAMSLVEEILYMAKIPNSEFLVQSYMRDSLYRENGNSALVVERLIPASLALNKTNIKLLTGYIELLFKKYREYYSLFADKKMGPIRQRAVELHTAVIDLAAKLSIGRHSYGDIDPSWLPQHTFIILSQIQSHTAGVLEDLCSSEPLDDTELSALDNTLDCMIETYDDLKEQIDEALESYKRNRLAIIRPGAGLINERLLQLSIGGTDIWRRVIIPENSTLLDIHKIIQVVFGWQNSEVYRFCSYESSDSLGIEVDTRLCVLEADNIIELLYEYGAKWNVRIMILSRQETLGQRPVRCVAGAGIAPPEFIAGPVRFKRLLYALESGNELEYLGARQELGADYYNGEFDLENCNKMLSSTLQLK